MQEDIRNIGNVHVNHINTEKKHFYGGYAPRARILALLVIIYGGYVLQSLVANIRENHHPHYRVPHAKTGQYRTWD